MLSLQNEIALQTVAMFYNTDILYQKLDKNTTTSKQKQNEHKIRVRPRTSGTEI